MIFAIQACKYCDLEKNSVLADETDLRNSDVLELLLNARYLLFLYRI